MLTETIADRITVLRADITKACLEAGRDPEEVRLLAVSKTFPIAAVTEANQTGQSDFGENYLQEAIEKVGARPDLNWHFIGAIQSNKTRDIAAHFDWVHSVPSFKVARRLSEQRPAERAALKLLFQVNTSGEASKSGVRPDEVKALIHECLGLPNVIISGLMTIPAAGVDTQPAFSLMRELKQQIAAELGVQTLTELSMGMTQDFRTAIQEGSTWIRVGTGIFGQRPPVQRSA